jgi:hypothetical protein
MKTLLLITAFFFSSVDAEEMRSLFSQASENVTANKQLMELTDGYTMDYKPVVYAYHAAAEMTMANHVLWPLKVKWQLMKHLFAKTWSQLNGQNHSKQE